VSKLSRFPRFHLQNLNLPNLQSQVKDSQKLPSPQCLLKYLLPILHPNHQLKVEQPHQDQQSLSQELHELKLQVLNLVSGSKVPPQLQETPE